MLLVTKGSLWCSFLYQIRSLWSYVWGMPWATHTSISNFPSSTIVNTLKPQPEKVDSGVLISIPWGTCDCPGPIPMSDIGCLTKYIFSLIHFGFSFFFPYRYCVVHVSSQVKCSAKFLVFIQPPLVQTKFEKCRKYMYKHDCILLSSFVGDGNEGCSM